MLSDDIGQLASALNAHLRDHHGAPMSASKVTALADRLEVLARQAHCWERAAIVAPLARVGAANDQPPANDGNVTRFPGRPQ